MCFSLKALFLVVSSFAIPASFGPQHYGWVIDFYFRYSLSILLLPVIFLLMCTFGSRLSESLCLSVSPLRSFIGFMLLVVSTFTVLYVIWARQRWLPVLFEDATWPRDWPYPDYILLGFHDWLDARYPAPPGSMKIHGEIYRVEQSLHFLTIVSLGVCSFMLGLKYPHLTTLIRNSSVVRRIRHVFVRLRKN